LKSVKRHKSVSNGLHSLITAALMMLSFPLMAKSQTFSCPDVPTFLDLDLSLQVRNFTPTLSCINLFPTNRVANASGTIRLTRPWSPFGVTVTPEGNHRSNLSFSIQGLPPPDELGDYVTYVAWASPLSLYPIKKLGTIKNGSYTFGEISLNKYIVLITAESTESTTEMTGPLVLRGRSPSSKMEAHDLLAIAPAAEVGNDSQMKEMLTNLWPSPPLYPGVPMLPGVMEVQPRVRPFALSGPAVIPTVVPHRFVELPDGGTLDLFAGLVRKTIKGREITMLAFNGQHPGPLIKVNQGSTIFVNFTNNTPFPSAVHWHGVRLDNRFDGVPGITQDPVAPGETFRYQIYFQDAGIYWYHPHHREDIQQELGLAGNILISPKESAYYNPVDREEIIMVDDFLLSEGKPVPFGSEAANYALMGRFGNLLLINGEPEYELKVEKNEVVRFYFTNAANTRTFNLSFSRKEVGDTKSSTLPIKVVASDLSKFMQETMVKNITLAPAERYVVEVLFDEPGEYTLKNHVQGINHRMGTFMEERTVLGTVYVSEASVKSIHYLSFRQLKANDDVVKEINKYSHLFDRQPDHQLRLTLQIDSLPPAIEQSMLFDRAYFNPVEWTGTMPRMNWATDTKQLEWILQDVDNNSENMEIKWDFKVGEVVKIRIHNDANAFHAMQHPLHIHGQRFLVLEQNGVPNDNLVWKDTVLLPTGSTTDILLELSNPGQWMVHCHIAEHLESGMKFVFNVEEE
jgi:suppressor of ftsI